MNAMKQDPAEPERPYSELLTQADQVRELLRRANLGQRAAAAELDINERTMRGYCAGAAVVPRVVMLALERLVDMARKVGDSKP